MSTGSASLEASSLPAFFACSGCYADRTASTLRASARAAAPSLEFLDLRRRIAPLLLALPAKKNDCLMAPCGRFYNVSFAHTL